MASLHIDGTLYKLELGKLYLVGGRRTDGAASRQPEIVLDCSTVEAKHALLDVGSDAVNLFDLKSASGTYVDGTRAAFTKLSLSSGCRELQFGSVKGKLMIRKSSFENIHDSSGYNDSHNNHSLGNLSPPTPSHDKQGSSGSFLIPQTIIKAPERKSDSFSIPETQAPINESSKNDEILMGDDYVENETDISDDFCIPETQEVVTAHYDRDAPPVMGLSPIREQPPTLLCETQDNDLDSGSIIRMCTQDFNETNEDSRDTTDSDLLLASMVIPHILHSPVKTVDQEATLNIDTVTDQPSVAANLNTTKATSPDRSGAVTPDIFELAGLPNEKETSKLLEKRLAAGTPDLFDTNEVNKTIKSSENLTKPAELVTATDNRSSANTPDLSQAEDEFDLMETQPFSVFQKNNPLDADRWNVVEERSCTPDLFDFAAPMPVAKPAKRSTVTNATLTCNAEVHAAPNKAAQQGDEEDDEEDEDDLMPTQPYSVFLKSMEKDKDAQKQNKSIGGTSSKRKSINNAVAENKTQMGNNDDFSASNSDSQATAMLPPGDEYDLMPTQPFLACLSQMNSTLVAGVAGKKSQNVNSFFETMEKTPQKSVTGARPLEIANATPAHSALPGSARCSQNSADMFCTPLGINAICGHSEQEPRPKAKPKPLNKRFFSDDEDDDDEEPGTFDVLLKKKTPILSAKQSKNESMKHQQFKLAFNTKTPVALARKREDRALKRQIKNLISDEPLTKHARKLTTNQIMSKAVDTGSEKRGEASSSLVETKKKVQSASKQKAKGKSISEIVTETDSDKNEKRPLRSRQADSAISDSAKSDARKSTSVQRSPQVDAVDELLKKKMPRKSVEIMKVQKSIEVGTPATTKITEPTKTDANELKKKKEVKSSPSVEQPKLPAGKQLRIRKSKSPVSKGVERQTTERNLRNRIKSPTKRSAKPDAETQATESVTEPKTRKKVEHSKPHAEESEPIKHERLTRGRRAKTPLVETGQKSAEEATSPTEPELRHHTCEVQVKLKSIRMPKVKEQEPKVKEQEPKEKEQEPKPTRRVTRLNSHLNDKDGAKEVQAGKREAVNQRGKQKTTKESSSKSKAVTRQKTAAKETINRSDSLTSEVYSKSNSEEQPTTTPDKSSSAMVAKNVGNELIDALSNKRETRQKFAAGTDTKLKNKNVVTTGAQKSSHSKNKHITADNDSNGWSTKSATPLKRMKVATSMVDSTQLKAILPDVADFISYTTDPLDFDVLLMGEPSRTFKFLVAMASGKPIMHISWLESVKSNKSTHTRSLQYFFTKNNLQKKYAFNFMKSLELARSKKLFEGFHFMATANVKPTVQEFKVIVECSGGTFHNKPSTVDCDESKPLCLISNKTDMRHWHQYRRLYAHLRIVDVEGVILAVLRQSLSPLDDHVIS